MEMVESDSIKTIRTEKQILKRKIHLKGQALKLIRVQKEELKERLSLLNMKTRLESQMADQFDPALSSNLDCVIHLLEFGEVGPHG